MTMDEDELNHFRQKLTDEQRREAVAAVAQGRPVAAVGRTFGISTAAMWNLVNKEALRLALPAGVRPDEYLRRRANGAPSPRQAMGTTSTHHPDPTEALDALREAAAALNRFVDLSG